MYVRLAMTDTFTYVKRDSETDKKELALSLLLIMSKPGAPYGIEVDRMIFAWSPDTPTTTLRWVCFAALCCRLSKITRYSEFGWEAKHCGTSYLYVTIFRIMYTPIITLIDPSSNTLKRANIRSGCSIFSFEFPLSPSKFLICDSISFFYYFRTKRGRGSSRIFEHF